MLVMPNAATGKIKQHVQELAGGEKQKFPSGGMERRHKAGIHEAPAPRPVQEDVCGEAGVRRADR